MASVFLHGCVAIAAGAPANRRTLNLKISTHFGFLSVSSWISYQYKNTIYKQILRLHYLNMVVGPKLGIKPRLKLSFKPKSN